MQAVILAAGQGQRIRQHHTQPKGFIEINGTPLISYSVEILRAEGINDITVITGYRADCYDEFAQQTGYFKTIYNPEFATFGNLYSFYIARQHIQGDILLVESDIIYEPLAVQALLKRQQENVVLVSGPTQSNDEVYVEAKNGLLTNMSKKLANLDEPSVVGEFVGLTRISQEACESLFAKLEREERLLREGFYDEDGLVALSKLCALHCHFENHLRWSEIDNVDQLERAKTLFPLSPLAIGA